MHLEFTRRRARRMHGDLFPVGPDLEVERNLADVNGQLGYARQVRLRIDPAGVHDVDQEHGARSRERRIVLQVQRKLAGAQLQLLAHTATRGRGVGDSLGHWRDHFAVEERGGLQGRAHAQGQRRLVEQGGGRRRLAVEAVVDFAKAELGRQCRLDLIGRGPRRLHGGHGHGRVVRVQAEAAIAGQHRREPAPEAVP